jgi:outer membrane protein with beta-barrel domain
MKTINNNTLGSLIICALIIFSAAGINSQIINKFGIKGGMILSKLTFDSDFNSTYIVAPLSKFACLKSDFAVYAELFDSRNFCTAVEIHYLSKGEDSKNPIKVYQPDTSNNYLSTEFSYVNDRFNFISLQVLPRWRFIVRSDDKMYLFGGPVFNYLISNSSAITPDAISLKNSKLSAGIKAGYGIELWDLFSIELSYTHDFNNAYIISYGSEKLNRSFDSFELLAGFNLKKLLRINL